MRPRPFLPALFVLTLAGCSAGSANWTPLPSGAEPPASCARADADGVIEISADQLRFSAPCMVAPAGVPFVIRFTNNESEVHNVAIYADRSRATTRMAGDTFSGRQVTMDYAVDPLAAGESYFDCVIHPAEMNGALYVR